MIGANPSPLSATLTPHPSPIGWAREIGWERGTGGIGAIGYQFAFFEFVGREEPELQGEAFGGIFWVEPRIGDAGLAQPLFQARAVFRGGQLLDGEDGLDQMLRESFRLLQQLYPAIVIAAGPSKAIGKAEIPAC